MIANPRPDRIAHMALLEAFVPDPDENSNGDDHD